jgi:beta-lactamase regulating signal transducer with metallopeptidase domain
MKPFNLVHVLLMFLVSEHHFGVISVQAISKSAANALQQEILTSSPTQNQFVSDLVLLIVWLMVGVIVANVFVTLDTVATTAIQV